MVKLRELLSTAIQKGDESQNSYAKSLGISSSQISKYLCGKEIGFHMVLAMVKKFYPNMEKEYMESYCREVSTPKNIKVALEYSHIKRSKDTYDYLLELAFKTNEETKEWAAIYNFQNNNKSTHELDRVSEISELKTCSIESDVLISILSMYGFYNNSKLEIAYDWIERIRPKIQEITDPFLRTSFTTRLDEVQAHISLKLLKDVSEARKIALRILESDLGPTYNSTGHFILGLSYITESYDKSFFHYIEAVKINELLCRETVVSELKEQVAFLQLIWGKKVDRDLSKFINDLLDGVNVVCNDPFQQAIAFYFQGCNENSIEKLFLSLHHFGKIKDFFRAELPKLELVKRNIPAEAF
ncbi:AimR family lysis-lysogeny pheromone receptor [Metabacillus indicus]|uniref:AimR family lysis-lysogeny pheromone receptor n=1 Tax=Metabacillus indicus TaxID=246786 RepID=UPI002A030AF6|nr:AimR family lysis-lysogeny pheromone receptor [Metabacillus indicus]MDX8288868.1 AimR family lysis-lysogeny pheromone receptor [Metabacillus indicus]